MLRSILISGLLGGFAAGLLAAVLHLLLVQPVLLQAERYESGELVHRSPVVADQGHADPAIAVGKMAEPPPLASTLEPRRAGLTALSFGLAYAGFGLLLAATMAAAEVRGHPSSLCAGLAWGAAGWVAVQLAPALGLPPELPGMAGADLTARQGWWAATAATTALGLAVLTFGRGWSALAGGLALVASMHVLGAPTPQTFTGPTPPELAALFAARTLGVGLMVWLALGWGVAALHRGTADEVQPRVT